MMNANKTGKRLIPAVLLLLLATAVFAVCSAETYVAVRDTASLNVRSGPDTSYAKLGEMKRGEWAEVIGESGNWYYLRTVRGGVIGYASKTYLTAGASGGTAGGTLGVVSNPKDTQFLNLRQYPSTSAPVLGIFYNGAMFTVLDSSVSGWYRVEINGIEGYFMSGFVTVKSPSNVSYGTVSSRNGGSVNLRSGPSTSCAVIGTVKNGTSVTILYQGKDFYKILSNGREGYMSSAFIRTGSSAPSTDPQPPSGPAYDTDGWCVIHNTYSSYVNLRKSASTGATVLKKAQNGLKYEMIMAGTEWCRVYGKSSGVTGYLMTRYVDLYDCSTYRTVRNGNSYVNLRSSASKSGKVYMQVPSGSVVTVVTPGETWCKVKYNGKTGYMMTTFLK